jgi:hypothetical protein
MRLRCLLNKTIDQMCLQASVSHDRTKADLLAYSTDCKTARDMADVQEQLLRDWLYFAKDVIPSCAAGTEWLDALRKKTMSVLDDEA